MTIVGCSESLDNGFAFEFDGFCVEKKKFVFEDYFFTYVLKNIGKRNFANFLIFCCLSMSQSTKFHA